MRQLVTPEEFDKVLRLDGTNWGISFDEEPVFDFGNERWQVLLVLPGNNADDEEEEQDVGIEWDSDNNRWVEVT